MGTYSDKTCFVVDNGIFGEIAVKLAKEFGKVYYYSPWEEAFVKSNNRLPGEGIEGLIRQNEIFRCKDEVDLWVFPDLFHADLQLELESQGHRVWGSRDGEELELYRDESMRHLKKLGLPVAPYKMITGMENLKSYLKVHENVYVKVSVTRGDFETFHSKNYEYIMPKLDELEHKLGAKKLIAEFMVQEAIDDSVEIGYDGFGVDGQFPASAIMGLEVKDKGYVGHVNDYKDMPPAITDFTEAISETMKGYRYRNFFSTENRVTKDKKSFMNDFCARQGSPPSELYINMIDNLADVLYAGAEGELIDPIFKKKWGAEVVIDSFWSDCNWQSIQFPDKIRDNVKLRQFCKIEDQYYIIPQSEGSTGIGAAVATGDTLEEAIKNVKEVCKEISGYYLTIHDDSLDDANDELEKLKNATGIEL